MTDTERIIKLEETVITLQKSLYKLSETQHTTIEYMNKLTKIIGKIIK